ERPTPARPPPAILSRGRRVARVSWDDLRRTRGARPDNGPAGTRLAQPISHLSGRPKKGRSQAGGTMPVETFGPSEAKLWSTPIAALGLRIEGTQLEPILDAFRG